MAPAVNSPASPADALSRAINAVVVIVVIGIAAYVYSTQTTKDAALFGAFTTFVGTVIAAFFGISATTQVSRSAVDSANQRVADANQQAGASEQKLSNLRTFANSADPNDPKHLETLRSLL